MLSDTSPSQTIGLSFLEIITIFIAGLLNNQIIWFVLAILVGYAFCRSAKQAATAGAGFAVFAIVMYLFFSFMFGAHAPQSNSTTPINLITLLARTAEWLLLSAIGGTVGGLVGFTARTRPGVLLVLPLFIVARLALNGVFSWQSPISAIQNIVFVLIGLFSIAYTLLKWRASRQIPYSSA
ncbi:MAG: hypothetical protein JWL85_72 [Candidatus Saccharibacteria bacterium]|nr:hypothetical protein [Candidatus Saccharibacteria bacterium]